MSLIQQALKRKLEEQQGREVPPPPPPLSNAPIAEVPPPLPPETRTAHPKMTLSPQGGGLPPPPPPSPASLRPTEAPPAAPAPVSTAPVPPQQIEAPPVRKGPRIAAVVVFLLVLALGGAVLYFGRGLFAGVRSQTIADTTPAAVIEATRKLPEVPVGPSSGVATATATTPAPAAATAAPGATAAHPATPAWVPLPNVGDVHTRVDNMKGKVTEVRSQTDAVLDDKGTPPAAAPGSGGTAAASPNSPVQPTPVPAVAKSPAGDVVWPSVRLTGVMARGSKGEKTALLNEAVVGTGESVDGITLIEVRDNGVMLEYKGDQRFFPLGRRR